MKRKKNEINLIHANKIFPNELYRLSPHDLVNISIKHKKLLTKKEQQKLQELCDEFYNGKYGGYSDLLILRKGRNRLRIVPF